MRVHLEKFLIFLRIMYFTPSIFEPTFCTSSFSGEIKFQSIDKFKIILETTKLVKRATFSEFRPT